MTIAYLNGKFLPLEKAQVPVMDRGFLFGDSIYEVIPVFAGQLFRFEQHIKRLQRSLSAIELDIDTTNEQWQQIFDQLIQRNGGGNQSLYLQVSRGPAAKREHLVPKHITPTIFAYSTPIPALDIEQLRLGITAITLQDNRWLGCYIKSTNLLANVLLRMQADEQKADEAILIRDGCISEGTASNVFIVQNEKLITPPLAPTILGGVTRDLVIELAQQHHIPIREQAISYEQLVHADEVWITSSTKHIRPVLMLDHTPVGQAKIGPLWESMIKHYQHYQQQIGSA